MNKLEIEKTIDRVKSSFQCLDGWAIDYVDEGGCDKVVIMPYLECAVIYPPSNIEEVDWEEYIMHEIMHVVFSDTFFSDDGREKWEDVVITDLCQLIWPEKFNV